VRSWINYGTEIVEGPSPSLVGQLVEESQPFWLDVENPTDEIIDRLAARLGLHLVAVEDSKQFGGRGRALEETTERKVPARSDRCGQYRCSGRPTGRDRCLALVPTVSHA